MAKYAWCTDIHLDHIDDPQIVRFAESLIVTEPAGVFITGDISDAKHIVYHLSVIERVVQRPVFFVLGNHDYYGGDFETTRKTMKELTNMSQFLKYLPLLPYVPLTPTTAVVGHDGWYDALNGNPKSRFMMNDWYAIKEFVPFSGGPGFYRTKGELKARDGMISLARKLAHDATLHVQNGIKAAARTHKNVIVLTHFPPFAEAHMYEGKVGDDEAQPWFTSKMMGDMLRDAAWAYPNVNFRVLAGHTHGQYEGRILPNLHVNVGGADYGKPTLAGLVEVT